MATISTLDNAGTGHMTRQDNPVPYLVEIEIDFADALEEKGSALAAADVIEAINVPAGTLVLQSGIQTVEVDDATTLTLDLGVTGGDVDQWVDGYDQAAAAAGDHATLVGDGAAGAGTGPFLLVTTADTIDVLFATLTGTLTVGKIRVWAILMDVSNVKKQPGIALIGS